jgi:hypothetical protein
MQTSAGLLYTTGFVYALRVAAVQKDAQTASAEREKLAEGYARNALALLRRAVQAGFHDLRHLKTGHPDLQALRGRADFQQLVQELEAKTKLLVSLDDVPQARRAKLKFWARQARRPAPWSKSANPHPP